MKETKEIKICESHSYTPTPLIYTYAFRGAEYWCPFCGYTGGILGSGTDVPETPELKQSQKKWKAHTKPFLAALSRTVCESFIYKGQRITYKEYPEKLKQKDAEIIKGYTYGKEISIQNEKMPPKEWFEKKLIGKEVIWGTNSFSDNAVVEILEKYRDFLDDKA